VIEALTRKTNSYQKENCRAADKTKHLNLWWDNVRVKPCSRWQGFSRARVIVKIR